MGEAARILRWESEARDARTELKRGLGLIQKALDRIDRIERELQEEKESKRDS